MPSLAIQAQLPPLIAWMPLFALWFLLGIPVGPSYPIRGKENPTPFPK